VLAFPSMAAQPALLPPDGDPTPVPASAVRAVTAEDVRAAQVGWPEAEPDRSVWRILSCAGPAPLSDEQLRAALPAFSLAEIAAAHARVAGMIRALEPAAPSSLEELLAEPSITLEEAIACGLIEDVRCASST
jgi:hypothetical protein